jgi:fructose-1-phosphate kinase PfkB-like protein
VESGSDIRFCYTIRTDSDVTELVEEAQTVGSGTEELLISKFDSLLNGQDFSYLIVSGTKAAGFSETLIPQIVHKAKEKGVKVILDVKGNDLIGSLHYKPDIIKPNIYEFVYTFAPYLIKNNDFPRDKSAEKKIREAMHGVNKSHGTRIILTDADKKILAMNEDDYFEIDVKPVKAVNTTGCGDAFTAGLASALEDGADFHAAIAEGNRCGALNAGLERPGVIC